jgi:hypothetical protein
MKFENPKMNISMFEVENIVTGSNNAVDLAQDAAQGLVDSNPGTYTGGVVTFEW